VTLGFGPSVCGVGGVLLLRRQFLWCSVLMVFGCVLCFRLLVLRWGWWWWLETMRWGCGGELLRLVFGVVLG
jgi:hypothetical protein